MLLSSLLDRTVVLSVSGRVDRPVGRVSDLDTDVGPGDVFVAIKGSRFDGHDRVPRMGHAAAVVVDQDRTVPPGPTVIRVADTRVALAPLCAARLGDPGASMRVVAVTGTNGKTSTTFLLAAMARAAGLRTGIIGTTGHYIDDEKVPASHTTPGAPALQALLARMRDAGCEVVAVEASSIGLAAHRIDAIPFRAAIFTNLTRDHLDWHGTMEAYASAKARLFHELLAGTAVLNAADPAAAAMAPASRRTWWFNNGDLRAENVVSTPGGTHARWVTPMGTFEGAMRLVGAHNVDNALGALGGALAAGVPLEACQAGLAALPFIPGRLQAVPNDLGFQVLVDYAHTDDALVRVLAALRALSPRRILTVFGCGGDRDRGKRPLMGKAAADGSDLVFVTSDNPRSEDPLSIIAAILAGIGARPHVVEPDRRRAIAAALAEARPGDVVLLAGKGHEATQETAASAAPFDDAAVAADLLRTLAPGSGFSRNEAPGC
ncbi:MAG: UDP-N-acetylmuramoyl-L-alanyl-D-glutamate--2,6-diaminopimelate ligase [Pseudomonadota bacterium]|nr:UDP-N-acetylmuramoyl-L-alanyl-D-glutamate--2,6-diaminopimelate ligase [Pseudomonadota bacterium]